MRILILGGTTEARELAGRLAASGGLEVTLSLAGRTKTPVAMPVPVQTGGFGGAEGLAAHLREQGIGALVDATHPFAAAISRNAAEAAARTGTPLAVLHRPPWTPVPGDRWTEVRSVADAVGALGEEPRRVFVALGRQEVAAFEAAPRHHYLIRSVDPVEPPLALPHAAYLTARGPFAEADERALLEDNRIAVVVAKNSGGAAAYGKIAAARTLALPVIVVRQPPAPETGTAVLDGVEAVVRFLDRVAADHRSVPAAARGV